jgi:GNAT superfamily N-acetyltransferase
MDDNVRIVTVSETNVAEHGFFCYKSKPKSEGYRRKLDWLQQRFAEGMTIHLLYEDGRSVGFIETIPGEFAWRAVHAPGYQVIHCLWVVGKGKGKGYGSRLLTGCIEEARQAGKHGVVMVSSSRVWLAGKELFLKHGFEPVDTAPPAFDLLVKTFGDAPAPAFPSDWDQRADSYGPGLTVIHAWQCPYMPDAVEGVLQAAREVGIAARTITLETCQQVQRESPSAYGVFGIVYNGRLLSYHYMLPKDLLPVLKAQIT